MWYIVELYEHLGGNNTQEVSENHSLTAHDPFKASSKFFKHSCVHIELNKELCRFLHYIKFDRYETVDP